MRSSYSFDEGVWGAKTKDDSKKIREKFASGFKTDESGNIIPTREKNNSMFSGDKFHGGDKKLEEKKARLSGKKISGKDIDMPEYLTRQKDFAASDARGGDKEARESMFSKFRLKDTDQKARTPGKSWLEKLGVVKTGDARESGRKYKTSKNRELAKAGRESAKPNPRKMSPGGGFYRDSDLSIDDVRDLVSPDGLMR